MLNIFYFFYILTICDKLFQAENMLHKTNETGGSILWLSLSDRLIFLKMFNLIFSIFWARTRQANASWSQKGSWLCAEKQLLKLASLTCSHIQDGQIGTQ